ncbi:putative ATP-binding cassette transporter [Aminobacter lissarensis]|uniref:ATP-binding cassette transporter n=1 Tax=Aminobacter carboxidus TaxID=376165 RepID=A0A8E2BEC8_9HYPH|nr:ABC transporter ATP-binding protein/permease [Aminobacter lissarensis]MBB6467602.1 putative ATP-binding cassette transporter [Aminobacter lissarensis]
MINVLRQFVRLLKLCISGKGGKTSLVHLAAVIALQLGGIYFTIRLVTWTSAFYGALEKVDAKAAIWQIWIFAGIVAANSARSLMAEYLQKMLHIRWRKSLTEAALGSWFADRAYWRLTQGDCPRDIDNPDQRIADDCGLFVKGILDEGIELITKIVGIFSYLVLLWGLSTFALSFSLFGFDVSIPRYMVWAAFIYVALSSGLTHLLGRPLKSLFYTQQKREGDFRFAMARIRQSADEIALMGGENVERSGLDRRFDGIAQNWRKLAGREFLLGCFTFPYSHTVLRIPLFVALPGFLAGSIALGGLMQIAMAFSNVVTTLSWFIFSYKPLSNLVAASSRLDGFLAATEAVRARPSGIVQEASAGELHVRDLKLRTPEGRELLSIPRLDIRPGETVWLRGQSGLGKTTLLKAMAGGWDHGDGRIEMPAASKLFLSQKAYFPQADIFGAVAYPASAEAFAQQDLRRAIEAVGFGDSDMLRLEDAAEGHPLVLSGLSGGELQRLALARALVLKPEWLFLDEATSALDEAAEAELFAMLRKHLPATTFVIVSHRSPRALGSMRVVDLEPKAEAANENPVLQFA